MGKKPVRNIFSRENIGIFLGFAACIIFWFPYRYQEHFLFFSKTEKLNLLPNLITGLIALFVMFVLYARKIIVYKKKSKRLVSMIVNLTLMATIIKIFINPRNIDKIHSSIAWFGISVAVIAAVIAVIVFGVQEFAKIAVLIGILFLCMSNLSMVSRAMDFMGFVNIIIIFSSFYLQQNINLKCLKNDFNYLFCKH